MAAVCLATSPTQVTVSARALPLPLAPSSPTRLAPPIQLGRARTCRSSLPASSFGQGPRASGSSGRWRRCRSRCPASRRPSGSGVAGVGGGQGPERAALSRRDASSGPMLAGSQGGRPRWCRAHGTRPPDGPFDPINAGAGLTKTSQMLSPLPSASHAPSIWYALVAPPQMIFLRSSALHEAGAGGRGFMPGGSSRPAWGGRGGGGGRRGAGGGRWAVGGGWWAAAGRGRRRAAHRAAGAFPTSGAAQEVEIPANIISATAARILAGARSTTVRRQPKRSHPVPGIMRC
jgi:hypothetical protein